jgi:hypothetical protein
MGTVVPLARLRAEREARARVAAERGSTHPALRWIAGDAFYIAHRKSGGRAACGAEGSLILAPPGVPLCDRCYPRAVSGESWSGES